VHIAQPSTVTTALCLLHSCPLTDASADNSSTNNSSSSNSSFWSNDLYPVDTVYMTRLLRPNEQRGTVREEVLKKVNMAAVCSSTGGKVNGYTHTTVTQTVELVVR
jgi:hypothetical protein